MPAVTSSTSSQHSDHRHFIDWVHPVLPTVVERLFEQYVRASLWDMRDLMIVLPGGVARRRLGELLALKARDAGKILYPPQIVSVGALPEHLYVAKFPFAGDLVQNLAWVRALQLAPEDELRQVVPIAPPKSASAQWLELGKILSGLHRELASDRLDFERVAKELPHGHPERRRWNALSGMQARYLHELDRLELWDIQTARLCALEFNEAHSDKHIIVVGCVDLNRAQRGFLEAVIESCEFWVAAPADKRSLFDPVGCLLAEAWKSEHLHIAPEQLLVADSLVDQAQMALACMAELGDGPHLREVTLGVADVRLVTELKHQFDLAGVHARYGAGSELIHSEPAVLLSTVGRFVEDHSYASFAQLIRHPAIENLLHISKLSLPENWLARIDEYYQAVLPKRIDEFVNESAAGAEVYKRVTQAIVGWLHKLNDRAQPISSWVQPLLTVLSRAYGRMDCDLNDSVEGPLYTAASQVCAAIVALRDIPRELEPKMTVSELIDWLLRSQTGTRIPEPSDDTALEMLGWLELSLDDAPHLIVTGIHDGVVPESANADAFLPNQLRRSLGMMDNARRYARDLYAMQVILHARQHVRIVVGKSDENGDPLVPSRLLMACDLDELPGRVLHLVDEAQSDALVRVERRWKPCQGASQIAIPKPGDVPPPRQVSVTAFRDYLRCPYRFYLRHVLKLRNRADADSELDAPKFGVLIHDTLAAMATSPVCRSADASEVQQFLISTLNQLATNMFGPQPPAAVLIQIEQAELRLQAFAAHQAERAAAGWEIRYTESGVDFDDQVLVGNEKKLHLIGRIDRIDYHPASGQWAIWDYKTSDNAKSPISVHWNRNKGWLDLQLPLYLRVAKRLGVGESPSLGYIALPKQASDTGFYVANFSAGQLTEAASLSDQVASRIAQADFWPPNLDALPYDDFARICQTQTQRVSVRPPSRPSGRDASQQQAPLAASVVAQAQALIDCPQRSHPQLEPLLIRASAGTGKTFQLSNRLLQIILSGQELDQILATTFTRKAAGEIMHRVLQRLAEACIDSSAQQQLAQHLPEVDTSPAALLAALRSVTANIYRLRISTLDSFFAQVVRTFSLEMGLPPGWSSMDPASEPVVQMQAIGRLLDNHDRRTLVDLVRMLAKGESGRQVADEILRTVGAGYDAFRSTEAEAWDQLPLPKPPSAAAFESAMQTLQRTRLNHKNADPNLERLYSDAQAGQWESVVAHGIFSKLHTNSPSYYGRELPAELCASLEVIVKQAAAELLPIRRNQTLASYRVIEAYDAEYSALIRRNRTLAFSDITYYLCRWMIAAAKNATGKPQVQLPALQSQVGRQLEWRLDCGVQHLLLDEFQDTSPEQWRILQPLATPLGGPACSEHSFFCVGDTKQAIYGWRGGVAEIFDSVDAAVPGLQQQQMQQSFRSSPEVMQVVNQVFQNLPLHSNFGDCQSVAKRWSEVFPPHLTSRKNLLGYVRLQNAPAVDRSLPKSEIEAQCLGYAAEQIAQLCAVSSASIGVLFRSNASVGSMIALLRDKGISASQDGGNPLTDSVAVELLLSLIHLADHPGDSICAFHVGTSPLASQLPYHSRTEPYRLASWFRRQVSRRGLGATLESVADKLADQLSWWDQHRLEQLIRSAYQLGASRVVRLREFEDLVLRQRVALPSESQVKVMTIHKSKGLEFDAVFLPDLETEFSSSSHLLVLRGEDPTEPPDGVLRYMNSHLQAMLPNSWQDAFAQNKYRGVWESLCLLYVAMTRARSALIMTTRPTSSPPTQQLGSLLQSTLATNRELIKLPQSTLFEIGDENWISQYPLCGESAETESTTLPLARISVRRDKRSAPQRGLRVSAPSGIHHQQEPLPLASAFSYSRSLGATYGTLIHAFFEQIKWLDDYVVDHRQLRKIAYACVEPEALRHLSLDKVIAEFEDMLQLSSVRAALGRKRYQPSGFGFLPDHVEIDNERVISMATEDRLISGTIDRLAVLMQDGVPQAAEIIDFKTDAYDPKLSLLWLDDRVEMHRPQLQAYAQVVSQLFQIPLDRIATFLVMLSTDDLQRVDSPPRAAETTIPLPHFSKIDVFDTAQN